MRYLFKVQIICTFSIYEKRYLLQNRYESPCIKHIIYTICSLINENKYKILNGHAIPTVGISLPSDSLKLLIQKASFEHIQRDEWRQ